MERRKFTREFKLEAEGERRLVRTGLTRSQCASVTVAQLTDRYEAKLSELRIKFDPKRLREIVGIYYPDFRAIANNFQFEFGLS